MARIKLMRRPERVAQRRKDSEERDAIRRKRTPQQQLDVLDARLGKGVGARRERAVLRNMISVLGNAK